MEFGDEDVDKGEGGVVEVRGGEDGGGGDAEGVSGAEGDGGFGGELRN